MRFKAKLDVHQIQLLYNLISPISRLCGSGTAPGGVESSVGGGSCSVMHLDPEHVRISTRGGSRGEGDGIVCFAELTAAGIFREHRIESVADDTIVFEIDLVQLRTALASVTEGSRKTGHGGAGAGAGRGNVSALHNSSAVRDGDHVVDASATAVDVAPVVLKLAKRNGAPCLCLDASTGTVDVHHAVPVRVLRAEEMRFHLPPQISMPDVQLQLPADRPLRTVVERLRALSPHVWLEGSMVTCDLTLRVDGEGASVRTTYGRLVPRKEDCKPVDENGYHTTTIRMDSKKLNACLQWQATMALGRGSASSAVLCMVKNEMLVLHVLLNPGHIGFFTYYVPVHFLSPEECI